MASTVHQAADSTIPTLQLKDRFLDNQPNAIELERSMRPQKYGKFESHRNACSAN